MNCPSCGHANPETARFCNECAGPLSHVCSRCGGENPPRARFCNECAAPLEAKQPERSPRAYTPKHLADKILRAKSALEGERKQVTVLFADLKGSTEAAERLDAEAWHAVLDRFFEILTDGVHRFEGTVNQYTGDGIMALFGAPIAHEDHAQRACYAALHLRDALRTYADELRRTKGLSLSTRLGLNSGEVVVGKIGDDLRMDYTAQGYTVMLAARMQELAEPGTVFATDHTARLVEGYFALHDLGEFALKGASAPLRVHQLEGLGRLRTRLEVSQARGFSRFVGRADEMATLTAALRHAEGGSGQVVGVVGEAGVGKSRLCLEFVEGCRARGITVFDAHCPAHGKAVPYLPFLEFLRACFAITEADTDQVARDKIAGRLLLLDDGFREVLPLVFDFLGVPDPDGAKPEGEPEARQQQLFEFLRRLVHARSRRETAVLLFDDLHWIDPGSDALLAQLVQAVSGTRTLLVANFRPEYHASWMQQSDYQQLPLRPLGPDALRELLRDLLGDDASTAALPELILARTGGNPFFAEEVVRALDEAGSLAGERGEYRLVAPVAELEIPARVQPVLAGRIDRLGEREKRVLQAAAVIGKRFAQSVLARVAELPQSELAAALSRLRDAEFMFEESLYPQVEYAFKHPLTQEVAYDSQLSERRKQVHASVAGALEEEHAGKHDEHAALIAFHWERAGENLLAARWHGRAGDRARSGDYGSALFHYRRVRALLDEATESNEAVELGFAARAWILNVGGMVGLDEDEASEVFAEGQRLAQRSPNPRRPIQLLQAFGRRKVPAGDARSARVYLEEAVERARAIADRGLETAARLALSWAHRSLGDLELALANAETASRELRNLPLGVPRRQDLAASALYFMCSALWELGRLREAETLFEADPLEQILDSNTRGDWYVRRAALHSAKGDPERALQYAEALLEFGERTHNAQHRAHGFLQLGRVFALQGRFGEAIDALEAGQRIGDEFRTNRQFEALLLAILARAYLGHGNVTRARETAERAIAVAQTRGSRHYEALAWIELARALQASDAEDQPVVDALERADSLIHETGALLYAPEVHEQRADLARRHGDERSRERELREAHRLYSEMGATGHADRLARELEHLGTST